ncbi:MAG: SCO1664 family protein [Anaerolineae bacterium]|nr:SCO1664 family protein [Anaerolineae bacterium]
MTHAGSRNPPGPERFLRLLSEGEIEVEGLIPWSSNATLLVTVREGDGSTLAIYKPQRGERPLWDFPHGSLGRREVATCLVAEALGWDLVPPTVLRDGPYGSGSVQLFVDAQEEMNFFTIQGDARYTKDLKRLAALDVICNNADRKAGHCLIDQDGRLWAIDNALTFHVDHKLRTVIWDFAGMLLPVRIVSDLKRLLGLLDEPEAGPRRALGELLSEEEISALAQRAQNLVGATRYPTPGPWRAVPWPLV